MSAERIEVEMAKTLLCAAEHSGELAKENAALLAESEAIVRLNVKLLHRATEAESENAALRAKIARAREFLVTAKDRAHNEPRSIHMYGNRTEIQRQGIDAALKELQ